MNRERMPVGRESPDQMSLDKDFPASALADSYNLRTFSSDVVDEGRARWGRHGHKLSGTRKMSRRCDQLASVRISKSSPNVTPFTSQAISICRIMLFRLRLVLTHQPLPKSP